MPHSRYSGRQQTDSGIAAVTAPGRGAPTQDFRGGAKPIALFSLQKTAKTASAPSYSHDSSGNDPPSLISNPASPAKAGAHGKSGSRPPVPCQGQASPGKRGICALGASVARRRETGEGQTTRYRCRRPSVARFGGRSPEAAAGWQDPERGRPSATVRPFLGPRRARTSAPRRALRGRS